MGWMAYHSIEPFGEMPAYWRNAMLATITANAHRSKGPPFQIEDFIPECFKSTPKKQTAEDHAKALQNIFAWAKRKGLAKEKEQ